MLYIVTPTYDRPGRMGFLRRAAQFWGQVEDACWIVVEDGAQPDAAVEDILGRLPIETHALATGPTRDHGNAQRALAFEHIAGIAREGVLYNADDDNWWHRDLPGELRSAVKVALLPVGNLGPRGVERPVADDHGVIVDWDAGWLERRWPVDMGGFALPVRLLHETAGPLWQHTGRGGESEFLNRFVRAESQAQLLCDGCRRCLVWHNVPLGKEGSPLCRQPLSSARACRA